jgi:hypothetical protein
VRNCGPTAWSAMCARPWTNPLDAALSLPGAASDALDCSWFRWPWLGTMVPIRYDLLPGQVGRDHALRLSGVASGSAGSGVSTAGEALAIRFASPLGSRP